MNTALIIIGFILWGIGGFTLCNSVNNKLCFIISLMFTGAISCIIISISNECKNIGALEVYRNNTELKIKYEIVNNDTISCDSIVIFKK